MSKKALLLNNAKIVNSSKTLTEIDSVRTQGLSSNVQNDGTKKNTRR